MVAKGTLIFSTALFLLIASLFGTAFGLSFLALAYLWSELWIAGIGIGITSFSGVSLYVIYGWFTEDV